MRGDFESFEDLKALRNKHIVHDENPFLQCTPIAVLNNGEKSYKIEAILLCIVTAESRDREQIDACIMKVMVEKALIRIEKEIETSKRKIKQQLEKKPYCELKKMEKAKVYIPKTIDVGGNRDKIGKT